MGVWIETHFRWFCAKECNVTPFVGVWIETKDKWKVPFNVLSHPSWVCGLKLSLQNMEPWLPWVTPFVGVWIETPALQNCHHFHSVTPFVGVWIETDIFNRAYT